jgi:hypothetical protein
MIKDRFNLYLIRTYYCLWRQTESHDVNLGASCDPEKSLLAWDIVWGSCLSAVSGSKIAMQPEIIAGRPRTKSGSGCQYFAREPTNGAQSPKAREAMEQVPMAWARRLVGYNSFVYSQTIWNVNLLLKQDQFLPSNAYVPTCILIF